MYFLAVLLNNNDEDHYCLGTNMAWHNHIIMMLMIYLSRKSKIITVLAFVVFFKCQNIPSFPMKSVAEPQHKPKSLDLGEKRRL